MSFNNYLWVKLKKETQSVHVVSVDEVNINCISSDLI